MANRSASDGPGLWVLGLGASHNGGACLLHDGRIVVAVQEERLSRIKRDRTYGARPSLAVQYCLEVAGIPVERLDMVVLCAQGDTGAEEHDLALNPQLRVIANGVPWQRISHHLGHAVSAYATSGFADAAVLVVDGMGSPADDLDPAERAVADGPGWETTSIYEATGATLTPVEKHMVRDGRWLSSDGGGMPRFASIGGMYSAVAAQLFGDPMDAGKVMGLAPFGTPTIPVDRFLEITDGAPRFRPDVPDRFRHGERWPARAEEYADLAASVQVALEHAVESTVARMRARSRSAHLCYAGGVALNCTLNERLWRGSGFARVHVPAPAEDSGTAVGAAYHGFWALAGSDRVPVLRTDELGRRYPPVEITAATRAVPGVRVAEPDGAEPDGDAVLMHAARRLARGEIGGWFDGGSELGPRALGHRSILADPRTVASRNRLNGVIKGREAFRPVAPVILAEHLADWFEAAPAPGDGSPFMLRTWTFRADRRDRVRAVVHVDGTGRAQTVSEAQEPRFAALLRCFHALTGVPLLVNTSFNGAGEPIVESPRDALWCLLDTGLDFLVLQDRIVEPAARPRAPEALLDLVPISCCVELTVPLTPGAEYTAVIRTPWGDHRRVLPTATAELMQLLDGVATVRSLAADPALRGVAQDRLVAWVTRLRRAGVIELRESAHLAD